MKPQQIDDQTTNTNKIAELNDRFRNTYWGGQVMATRGVSELSDAVREKLFKAVMEFDKFTPDNDPYGEHDFGKVVINNTSFFWKIDCYDLTMTFGSPNPADPSVTCRVLTIMLASEY